MLNRFANQNELEIYLKEIEFMIEPLCYISIPCYAFKKEMKSFPFPKPIKDSNQVMNYYLLDAASLLAVEALDIRQIDKNVLDMCAAPGGKSLAILQKLLGNPGASLHCNERSNDRRKRLQRVLHDYLPLYMYNCITITRYDGTVSQWFKRSYYDKVLVDAPCSSDRHVLHNREEIEKWNPPIYKEMAQRQYLLLLTALSAVKPGGLVVYSTCSLSEQENDFIIDKAFDNKFGLRFEVMKKEFKIGEATKHGWIILPDREGGWGPLYFTILQRKEEDIKLEE